MYNHVLVYVVVLRTELCEDKSCCALSNYVATYVYYCNVRICVIIKLLLCYTRSKVIKKLMKGKL